MRPRKKRTETLFSPFSISVIFKTSRRIDGGILNFSKFVRIRLEFLSACVTETAACSGVQRRRGVIFPCRPDKISAKVPDSILPFTLPGYSPRKERSQPLVEIISLWRPALKKLTSNNLFSTADRLVPARSTNCAKKSVAIPKNSTNSKKRSQNEGRRRAQSRRSR